MTTTTNNSVLSAFEARIGIAPGNYPTTASDDDIRAWLIAQGIPRDGEHGCGKSSRHTLRNAYQEPRYLSGWKKRLASGQGWNSRPRSARSPTDLTAASRWALDDLASFEDDEATQEANALADIGDALVAVPESTATPNANSTSEAIAKAADIVIGNRLDALTETLKGFVKGEVAGTELKFSAEAKAAIRALVVSTARETVESLTPTRIEIHDPTTGVSRDLGLQHAVFPKLLRAAQARLPNGFRPNIWLTGPAGSGKTTAVENIARALALSFASDGSLDADYKVLGFKNAQGEFVSTEFLKVFESGGIYCADEIDNWLPSALLSLNSALANGWISTARGMIPRHKDFLCIACANTWGMGATNDYVGRTKLDAASLDRFQPKIDWPIDEVLELNIAQALGGAAWCKIVQEVRRNARAQGLQVIISPRATYAGIALLESGFDIADTIDMTVAAGLKPEQRKALSIDAICARSSIHEVESVA